MWGASEFDRCMDIVKGMEKVFPHRVSLCCIEKRQHILTFPQCTI
jgi:hypothetical protein